VTVTVESAATGTLSDTDTVDAIESDLESANNTDTDHDGEQCPRLHDHGSNADRLVL
jgi:hypothetical protein